MLVYIVHKLRAVFGEAEEIGLLLSPLDLASAVGALVIDELALSPEALAGGAVPALVLGFVYIVLLYEAVEDLLDLALVHRVCRADEAVVARVHNVPDALYLAGGLVDELLRSLARSLGLELDLLSMLVGAGLEVNVVPRHSLEAANGVRKHDLIGVAYVRLARSVSDSGGKIVVSFVH